MSYAVAVIFACVAMAILIAMAHQIWTYVRGLQIISRRQFILRITNGILLLGTIGMIFYAWVHRFTNPVTALVFWGLLSLTPVAVMILAWLDLRELSVTRHKQQAELYRDLANLQQDLKHEPRDKH